MALEPGATGRAERTVSSSDTGAAVGSSDMPYLATPVLLALCEVATRDALEGALPAASTSVSMRLHFDHVRPVAVGEVVSAAARLERLEGRRLTFIVEAHNGRGELVGSGRLVHVIVDRDRFMRRPEQDR